MATIIERFESKFIPEPNTGCWLWTAGLSGDGYGKFDGKARAHRVAFELYVGQIPSGLWVLHRCDQPLCVNPAHLFLGSRTDNVADMMRKRRQATGDRNASAKLNAAQVAAIRSANGEKRSQIAARFGVGWTAVDSIRRGKTWKHLQLADGLTNSDQMFDAATAAGP